MTRAEQVAEQLESVLSECEQLLEHEGYVAPLERVREALSLLRSASQRVPPSGLTESPQSEQPFLVEGDLKPCPFCGGEADVSEGTKGDNEPWWYVECMKCGATGESVEAWNKRPAQEAPLEGDAAAKELRDADIVARLRLIADEMYGLGTHHDFLQEVATLLETRSAEREKYVLVGWIQMIGDKPKMCFNEGERDPRTVHDNGKPCFPVYALKGKAAT
jgi:hypothetical protein